MFQHDCLDTCCFECLIGMCFVFAPVQCKKKMSMFHMERCSRNKLIIIIIIMVPISMAGMKECGGKVCNSCPMSKFVQH